MSTKFIMCALMCAGLMGVSACGASPQVINDDVTQRTPEELLFDYRTVLNELRIAPFARETARELDMAQVWLERAERLLDEKRPDKAQTELLLGAVEGQLLQIKSYHAKRAAQDKLEQTRQSYERRAGVIERARQTNDTVLEQSTEEVP